MRTLKRRNQFLVVVILCAGLMIPGCVTRNRFQSQVSETQLLADQLEGEKQKREELEKDAANLKERISTLDAELAASKEDGSKKEIALKDTIAAREKQRDAAMAMGAIVERTLNDEIDRLKGELAKEVLLAERQTNEMAALRAELEANNQEKAKLGQTLELKEDDLARMKRELAESSKTHRDLVEGLRKEISEGNVKITQIKGRLSVEIVDKILFPSGSDQITPEGTGVLKKVSDVLKNVKEHDTRIEGHTDNVPIGPRLKDKFPTNWELSTARSTQVVRFLTDQGLPPENVQAAGFSMYRPVDTNETPEGKQRNRRIEIVLFPRDISRIVEGVN